MWSLRLCVLAMWSLRHSVCCSGADPWVRPSMPAVRPLRRGGAAAHYAGGCIVCRTTTTGCWVSCRLYDNYHRLLGQLQAAGQLPQAAGSVTGCRTTITRCWVSIGCRTTTTGFGSVTGCGTTTTGCWVSYRLQGNYHMLQSQLQAAGSVTGCRKTTTGCRVSYRLQDNYHTLLVSYRLQDDCHRLQG